MHIKICGLSRPADALAANAVLPDCVGFVFAPASRRYVTPAGAATLRAAIDPSVDAVGVFVDADAAVIAETAAAGTVQAVQLHGREDAAYIARLRTLLPAGTPIWKAIRMGESTPTATSVLIDPAGADVLLLDSGAGSGVAFDWARIPADIPQLYWLAGGIGLHNVRAALRCGKAAGAYGLDISGGAETEGVKDADKIRRLVNIIREA